MKRILQGVQLLFERLVQAVEEHPAPLSQYVLLFVAILAVRLSLEFFSSHRLFGVEDMVHIGLWFLFIVLAFMLQLHLFSGVPIEKVMRLCITGFTIALSAPILDLLISGGVGAKMNYLHLQDAGDAVRAYFTLGGPSLSRGATLGIRLEIVLLMIASFNYVRTKRKHVLWGLLGALSIYTVLFASGAIPWLLVKAMHGLGLSFQPDDLSTLLLLLCLDLCLIALILGRHRPKALRAAIRHFPWGAVALGIPLLVMGALHARHSLPDNWSLNPTTLFQFPLLLGIATCLGVILSLQQVEAKGIPEGLSQRRGRIVAWTMALVAAWAIDPKLVLPLGACWGLIFFLNEPPLHLRRAPLLRNLLEAMLAGTPVLLGTVAFKAPMVGFPDRTLLMLLLWSFVGSLALDGWRREDDAWAGYRAFLWSHPWGSRLLACSLATIAMLGAWLTLGVALHWLPWVIGVAGWCVVVIGQLSGRRMLQVHLLGYSLAMAPIFG